MDAEVRDNTEGVLVGSATINYKLRGYSNCSESPHYHRESWVYYGSNASMGCMLIWGLVIVIHTIVLFILILIIILI